MPPIAAELRPLEVDVGGDVDIELVVELPGRTETEGEVCGAGVVVRDWVVRVEDSDVLVPPGGVGGVGEGKTIL